VIRLKLTIATLTILLCVLSSSPVAIWAQEGLISPAASLGISSQTISKPDDRIYAITLTRFHFITLKQFHSGLFTSGVRKGAISDHHALLINKGLNAYLTSTMREKLMLKAMRENKSVELRFNVSEETSDYVMVPHPRRELLFHYAPEVKQVETVIEIQPLMDGPNAFQVTLRKSGEDSIFHVDWHGEITQSVGAMFQSTA